MNTQQLLTDAAERARQMIADAGITNPPEVIAENNGDEDAHLRIGEFYVMPVDSEGHGTDEPDKVSAWCVSVAFYCPGVRYYRDGSGEPPSEDIIDLSAPGTVDEAIKHVLHSLIDYRIDAADEHRRVQQMVQDEGENDYREHQSWI